MASAADVLITADATSTTSTTGSNEQLISRQPPTVADTTAAASRSPTLVSAVANNLNPRDGIVLFTELDNHCHNLAVDRRR